MHTTTHNAAREAVMAKPCLAQLVLQAEDDTEALRTVLRAYRAIETLMAYATHPHAAVSGDELAALLLVHNRAMDIRLHALAAKIETVHTTLRACASDGPAAPLALQAIDHLENLRGVREAYGALQSLVPYAEHTTGDDLSAALQMLNEAMTEHTAQMDDKLDALHAALVSQGTAA